MGIRYTAFLILSVVLLACKPVDQQAQDVLADATQFAEKVLGDRLRIHFTDYKRGNINVDALFGPAESIGYTTFSNEEYVHIPNPTDLLNSLLYVSQYKDEKSAEEGFDFLKFNSQVPVGDVEGMVGRTPVQVRFLDTIKPGGGLFVQQDDYLFFLPKTCETPPIEDTWENYEMMFLRSIAGGNDKMEIINVDCGGDEFDIRTIKVNK